MLHSEPYSAWREWNNSVKSLPVHIALVLCTHPVWIINLVLCDYHLFGLSKELLGICRSDRPRKALVYPLEYEYEYVRNATFPYFCTVCFLVIFCLHILNIPEDFQILIQWCKMWQYCTAFRMLFFVLHQGGKVLESTRWLRQNNCHKEQTHKWVLLANPFVSHSS